MLQHHSCVSAAAAYWPPDVINNVLLKLLPPHKLLPLWPWVPCNSSLNESSSILSCTGLDTGGPLSFSKQHTCFFFAKEPHFGLSDYLPQKALKQLLINLGNFISFFFWHIVDLYCCVSFSYTAKWIRHTYKYPCFLNFLYIQVTQSNEESSLCYTVGFFLLVICFIPSSVYMSISIPQFIPTPFSSLVSVHLFSTSVSLFLLCQ